MFNMQMQPLSLLLWSVVLVAGTAEALGWADTFVAEYVALTKLQGDALVLQDAELAKVVRSQVATATLDDLLA